MVFGFNLTLKILIKCLSALVRALGFGGTVTSKTLSRLFSSAQFLSVEHKHLPGPCVTSHAVGTVDTHKPSALTQKLFSSNCI